MKFKEFLFREEDPMQPVGLDPMQNSAPPAAPEGGGDPSMGSAGYMAMPPGTNPMDALGASSMMGSQGFPKQEIPKLMNVWDVIDHLLNGKDLKDDNEDEEKDQGDKKQPVDGPLMT